MRAIGLCAGVSAALGAWTAANGQVIVGFDAGGLPLVRVYDPVNPAPPLASFLATTPGFSGGVRVAVGDVNGDGMQDTVVGLGPGVVSEVKVYSGTGTVLLSNANTYGPSYTGGVHVAAGDVDNDGRADVITGTSSGSTHVKVFSGATGALLRSFFAFGPSFTGGVSVGAGDVNSDGFDDILVGADSGAAGGHVKAFSGATGAELMSFLAFPGFAGSLSVAGGDVNGDGRDDIIVGAGPGGAGGHVKVFDGVTGAEIASFLAYPGAPVGVRVGAVDRNGDGVAEVLTGSGPGVPAEVRMYSATGALIASFMAGDPGFTGGVFVGGSDSGGCYADCTGDGALTVADFACFQAKFVGGSPYADCNADGARTIADFACFQSRFVQGCP